MCGYCKLKHTELPAKASVPTAREKKEEINEEII